MAMKMDVVREETIDSSKIENPDGCFEGRGREALRGGVPRLGQIDGAYPWRHLERGRSSSPTWPYEDKVCRASHSSKSNRGQTGPRTQPQRGEAGLAHNTSPARPRALAPEWIMWRLQIRDPPGWLLGHLPAVPMVGRIARALQLGLDILGASLELGERELWKMCMQEPILCEVTERNPEHIRDFAPQARAKEGAYEAR